MTFDNYKPAFAMGFLLPEKTKNQGKAKIANRNVGDSHVSLISSHNFQHILSYFTSLSSKDMPCYLSLVRL